MLIGLWNHPFEANLSRCLHPGLTVRALSAGVASALGELELDPEAPNISDTGLEKRANPIDVLSRPYISIFTPTLFDFIPAGTRAGLLRFAIHCLRCIRPEAGGEGTRRPPQYSQEAWRNTRHARGRNWARRDRTVLLQHRTRFRLCRRRAW